MDKSKAHIVAMTGSYFRGDSVPILLPEDEKKFTKVTYNYYEQLNGYEYLKTLGIGYHFYQGRYTNAIMEVLDTTKRRYCTYQVLTLASQPRTSTMR